MASYADDFQGPHFKGVLWGPLPRWGCLPAVVRPRCGHSSPVVAGAGRHQGTSLGHGGIFQCSGKHRESECYVGPASRTTVPDW